ncbi:NADPH-dependent 7-cyano-7-deazaguanine reductase QueF [Alteromonadaceae bacterium M269]|nr:NADPH-dependent 7-cyano-7-deazaguanine reductase QueF [Alteromonadaceae bacterium M269]
MTSNILNDIPLGKTSTYTSEYSPELLKPVPRSLGRSDLKISDDELPFSGGDLWTGYELSWLNTKGKPQVAIMTCEIPVTSPNLVESKSFKLYLNSFNQTRIESIDEVKQRLTSDLSNCAGENVKVELYGLEAPTFDTRAFDGTNIDDLDISVSDYDLNVKTLTTESKEVSETVTSHLLKSNCLITNQPDWASVAIRYQGKQINHEGLLKYLISFRQHNEFHEQCVERIFTDIMYFCAPQKLTVYARYTRRGGLDINPFRSNFEPFWGNVRLSRQ